MNHITPFEDHLNRDLLKAAGLHLSIVLIAFIFNTFLNLNLFNFSKKPTKIQIIQSAVRVDLVELPKMTLQELKKITLTKEINEIKPPVKLETKVNETSKIEYKKKAKKLNLNNILKNLSSKKVKTNIVKKKRNKISKAALKRLILEGNKISKGASTTGIDVSNGQQEYIEYIQMLPNTIRPNWKLPSYLLDRGLRCRIRVYIGRGGKILKTEIFESSGDNEFDRKALGAIMRSSPLPRPAANILRRVTNGDVILGFPL